MIEYIENNNSDKPQVNIYIGRRMGELFFSKQGSIIVSTQKLRQFTS